MPKRVLLPNREQNLQDALEDLRKDPTLSIRMVAGRRAVPESTLRDRRNKGRQTPISAHTHECLLSPAQEDILVKWALFQDDMGIPPRQELLIEKAEAILHLTNPSRKIGKCWIQRFMKRHKELQMRFTQRLDRQRAAAGNPKIMEKHFSIFKKAVKDYRVLNINI
jgi:helix-turn-helix, Psq domain./Tc5 transposase DNA-binding domain.